MNSKRKLHKLSPTLIKAKHLAPRDYSDGGNLYFRVTVTDSRSWVFRYRFGGKEKELGLGSARDVSLSEAREKAAEMRAAKAKGIDPAELRLKAASCPLGQLFEEYVATFITPELRDPKAKSTWLRTVKALPKLMSTSVDQITPEHVRAAIQPFWQSKNETATRYLQRIERVLNYARTRGFCNGPNPAAYKGNLEFALPKVRRIVKNHRALQLDQVPQFFAELRKRKAPAARAMELAILTASRTGEIIKARWEQFDLDAGIWTRPGSIMKGGKEHRVALSKAAISLLRGIGPRDEGFVFGNERPLSNMAMLNLRNRMGWKSALTTHGFRSSFKDWSQTNGFDHLQTEMCIAHTVLTSTQAAYWRNDMLDQRRPIMEAWAEFLHSTMAGLKVIHSMEIAA